jgi:putative SOS response-associated peptidase YedK
MPAILRPEQFAAWLDPAATTKEPVLALLQTYPVEEMAARPVSDRVNGVNCDAPELIEYCSPPEAPKPQPGLFDL